MSENHSKGEMEYHSEGGEGGRPGGGGGEGGSTGGGGGGGGAGGAGGCGGTRNRPAQNGQDGVVILLPPDRDYLERRPDEIVNRKVCILKKREERPEDCEKN